MTIAQQGVPERGVPACVTCHGHHGEGSEIGPRLAGQNVQYIKSIEDIDAPDLS